MTKLPELSFPEAEAACVRQAYRAAHVILEYGSGGSSVLGASLPGKLVFSVESDLKWAMDLQRGLDAENLPSQCIVYHVDIGPTGRWGRPVDASGWRRYAQYPNRIWTEPFFRAPNLVLIDGRLRAACFVATYLRTKIPVRILFDDYFGRPAYHVVERLSKPAARVGRMAEFHIEPGDRPMWVHDLFNELIGDMSIADGGKISYEDRR